MTDAVVDIPKPAPGMDTDIRGRAGIAPIKAEYIIEPTAAESSTRRTRPGPDDDAAEGRDSRDARDGGEGNKRQKTKGGGWKKRIEKSKVRPTGEATIRMCKEWESTGSCSREKGCKFQHSWEGYWEVKPQDIHHEMHGALADTEPYTRTKERVAGGDDLVGKTIDLATECPVYKDLGYCTFGWRCRFLGGHVKRAEEAGEDSVTRIGHWELLGKGDNIDLKRKNNEINWPDYDVIHQLRNNKYDWRFTTKYLALIEPDKPFFLAQPKGEWKKNKGKGNGKQQAAPAPAPVFADEEAAMNGAPVDEEAAMNGAPVGEAAAASKDTPADEEAAMNAVAPAGEEAAQNGAGEAAAQGVVDGEAEAIDVPLRPEEKRRLNWDNGLYLAPLTTVGNLPFRRLCVDYGASITISEMALSQPLITGAPEEWSLVRRHESEKMFGVQLAGGFPNRMVPAAELLARELGPSGIDFVDINMGCPIDLLFNQGAGSALMDAPARLGKVMVGMNRALGEIPLTIKFRMGIASGKPNAHKLMPRMVKEWGAGALTLHGRSRQQRYSKLADWSYIKQCVEAMREEMAEANMAPVPIFGNGDCFSAQSYWEEKERSGVDGVMVARGALIKPWIFTEIAERREWDISATERLEGIRKFAEYGLSHWGSDTQGVNITRRFLCEALSFQHRYVPIGLLERMPPMLNERPPKFRGRSELETLLASPFSGDWVRISEMFLGPVDASFAFTPKHNSNSYGNEDAQG